MCPMNSNSSDDAHFVSPGKDIPSPVDPFGKLPALLIEVPHFLEVMPPSILRFRPLFPEELFCLRFFEEMSKVASWSLLASYSSSDDSSFSLLPAVVGTVQWVLALFSSSIVSECFPFRSNQYNLKRYSQLFWSSKSTPTWKGETGSPTDLGWNHYLLKVFVRQQSSTACFRQVFAKAKAYKIDQSIQAWVTKNIMTFWVLKVMPVFFYSTYIIQHSFNLKLFFEH